MLHFDNEFEIGDDLTCIVFLDVDMHGYMYVFWMYGDFIIPLSLAIVNLMYCIYLLIIELNVYITMQTMIILKKIFIYIRLCRSFCLHTKAKDLKCQERHIPHCCCCILHSIVYLSEKIDLDVRNYIRSTTTYRCIVKKGRFVFTFEMGLPLYVKVVKGQILFTNMMVKVVAIIKNKGFDK